MIDDEELLEIEDHACPGAGACGGQFTANTMATVMELIGLSPMGTAAVPQVDPRKYDVAFRCGAVIMDAVRRGSNAARYMLPAKRSTTRLRPSRPPADRPMPSCTCWRWLARRRCRLRIDDFETDL